MQKLLRLELQNAISGVLPLFEIVNRCQQDPALGVYGQRMGL